jgi:hypothetical protein
MIETLANAHGWLATDPVPYRKALIATGLLVVAMMLAFAGVTYLRRKLHHEEAEQPSGAFTLDDLRNLHQQGHLTQEEYQRARQQTIAQFSVGIASESSVGETDENLRPPEGTSSS